MSICNTSSCFYLLLQFFIKNKQGKRELFILLQHSLASQHYMLPRLQPSQHSRSHSVQAAARPIFLQQKRNESGQPSWHSRTHSVQAAAKPIFYQNYTDKLCYSRYTISYNIIDKFIQSIIIFAWYLRFIFIKKFYSRKSEI